MGQPVADNELIAPGSGLVIRKYRNAGATTARWTNLPGYTGN
jgi:hypothetical protein